MGEEKPGAELVAGIADPIALGMAISRASPAVDEELTAYLRDQRHHLHEQLKQIHLDIWEKWLGVFLRLATLCVGIGVATGVGMMVWDAAHSKGLLIEPFSVPSDMASHGLTGQAMASRLLDKLTEMQNGTESGRPPQSYTNNWGDDIKVEIPETGVSVGEFRRILREWLGHDTHITGEVWRTADGVAITARAGGDAGEIVTGKEADLDTLVRQAAENVYRVTQPYRYANYLDRDTYRPGAALRLDEAEAIYRRLIYDPNPVERAWAWNGLANQAWQRRSDVPGAIRYYYKTLTLVPNFSSGLGGLAFLEKLYGHPEQVVTREKRFQQTPETRFLADNLGDYAKLARICRAGAEGPEVRIPGGRGLFLDCMTAALAGQHDGQGLRDWLHSFPDIANSRTFVPWLTQLAAYSALQDWHTVIAFEAKAEQTIHARPGWDLKTISERQFRPRLAQAKAMLGDIAGAEALIAPTPTDCYDCTRIRAIIAALANQPDRADTWFARAVHDAPSIPFAYSDWGKALLERGQPDAAITKFRQAKEKGPHFADPLEGWGEALMAKSRSHLALAKFATANQYAPNWGRLHLKWGEALVYAGKKAEAQKHFARAAQLDLTPSEKSELSHAVATNP